MNRSMILCVVSFFTLPTGEGVNDNEVTNNEVIENVTINTFTVRGMRVSVSSVKSNINLLSFDYTLKRGEYAPFVFRSSSMLTISYFDGQHNRLQHKDRKWIAIDALFITWDRDSTTASVKVTIPRNARFFSVELNGFGLVSDQIKIR
jgi:hypothetical protein